MFDERPGLASSLTYIALTAVEYTDSFSTEE